MGYESHLLGYRMESNEELLAEKVALKAQRSIFTQQSMGSKGLTRDLRLLEDKLQAVNFVLASRGYVIPENSIGRPKSPMVGVSDFGGIER